MSEFTTTWKCALCSYLNASNIQSCEMCDAPPSKDQSSNLKNQSNNNNDIEIVQPIYMNYNSHSESKYANNNNTNNNHDSNATNLNMNSRAPQYNNDNNNIHLQKNQWQCTKCTCFNHIDLLYCEVCLSKREHNNNNNNKNTEYKNNVIINQPQPTFNNDHFIEYKQEYKQPVSEHKSNIITDNNYQQPHANVLNDNNIAQQIQNEESQRMKQYYADLETAKQLQHQLELEQNIAIAQQIQAEEKQKIKRLHHDINSAKQLEQKYQADDIQFTNDRQIALKMQKEFAEGLAWFCSSCFTMNLNVQSYECDACGTKRPKPKIPDVLTVRDQVAMKMIEMLRNGAKKSNVNCIVNLVFAQNFVTKYLQMCKQRGLKTAKPQICYHWTRTKFFDPIKKTGLKVPDGQKVKHMTDTGYYGKGIYMSPDPKYAQGYGYGAKTFFGALSLTGKQFSAKYPRDLGCSLKKGYDSHFSSDRINAQTGIPNEWIFFKPEQLLLCFHMSLEQVRYIVPVLNEVINYLVSKYDQLNKKGGIRGL